VAEALEFGIVSMNAPVFSTEVAPFGGIKESGFGKEGSKYGLDDYLITKYVLMGGV
jgi:succinate-semialdehyde dehydrogenase/glutarate-semialdehyde dehydrogenase